jgi:hypothetical protein
MTKAGYNIPDVGGGDHRRRHPWYPGAPQRHARRDGARSWACRWPSSMPRASAPGSSSPASSSSIASSAPSSTPAWVPPLPGRGAVGEPQGNRHRAHAGDGAARHPHHRHAGDHHLGLGDPLPRPRPWASWAPLPGRDLRGVHVAAAQGRGLQHPAPVQHRDLPGRLRQTFSAPCSPGWGRPPWLPMR